MATTLSPENLYTLRLELRSAVPKDAPTLHASYFSSALASRFLGRLAHRSLKQTQALLDRLCVSAWAEPASCCAWVVADRFTHEAAGIIFAFAKRHVVEIHYGVGLDHQRQGCATEAVAAVANWLLNMPSIQRVWTAVDVEHVASRRVLEKLGFQSEGLLRSWAVLPAFGVEARDAVPYSLVKVGRRNDPIVSDGAWPVSDLT
jgi:ribosomal-protein-alanine N-acetyltransferase